MAIDIDKIFKTEAQSSYDFLITPGQCCYIPAYQRPYSWDRENVTRLFEDAVNGISMLLEREHTISFLGTIIVIHDTDHQTILPNFQGEVPTKVMTIIDGQQRICTFFITNIAIHDLLKSQEKALAKKNAQHFLWLKDEALTLIAGLEETFILDTKKASADGNFKFYPRIIRSYHDVWSRKKNEAQYSSPIAQLIWKYFTHSQSNSPKPFKYEPTNPIGRKESNHEPIIAIFKIIQRTIKDISKGDSENIGFPEMNAMMQSKWLINALWGHDLPTTIKSYISEETDDVDYEKFVSLFRLILLSKYLNKRVAFTVVTTDSEDDAFDMFEALNTTGEPLTAFETFKPKVIDAEGIIDYEKSPSYASMSKVEEYLDTFTKAEQKQKFTSEMLVSFALSETGDKLQKNLNEQRRYLQKQYKKDVLPSIEERREFVERLADISVFMKNAWNISKSDEPKFGRLSINDEESLVGFKILRDLNHQIVIPPLLRFFTQAREAKAEDIASRSNDFIEALKATIAFSTIWRGAKGNTANIDGHYRTVMRDGVNQIAPLSKRPPHKTGITSVVNYKKSLNAILQNAKLHNREEWVKHASRVPIYHRNAVIARFLLFLASHDAAIDETCPGLISKGRKGLCNMLSLERWRNSDYFSVEHIAPQTKTSDWKDDIYERADTIHCLGNLTLLPREINTIVGNKSWEQKRNLYRVLSAETPKSLEKAMGILNESDLVLGDRAQEILQQSPYLRLCASIALKDDDWTLDFIEKRSVRIAELAWDNIAHWLD